MCIRDSIQAVLAGRRSSFTLEYPCHSPRAPRWFTMTVTPLETGGGVVIAHTDITERKQAEEKLRVYSEYQRAVLDNFPFLVWLKDRESRLLAANAAYAPVSYTHLDVYKRQGLDRRRFGIRGKCHPVCSGSASAGAVTVRPRARRLPAVAAAAPRDRLAPRCGLRPIPSSSGGASGSRLAVVS